MNTTTNERISKTSSRSLRQVVAIASGLLLASICWAAKPPPTAALQAAEIAISTAEQAHVSNHAPLELTQARRDLNAANDAVREKNMTLALYLAEESKVGAQLASAKADVAEAQIVNDNMIKSIATLKDEMNRNAGKK